MARCTMSLGSSSNINKTVSPIKIINKQFVSKNSLTSKNQNQNKRSLSTSPNSPTMPPNNSAKKKKNKLFVTPNRYSVLTDSAVDNNDDQSETISQEHTDTTTHTSMKGLLPPPIFIKGVRNFSDLLSELKNLIGPNSFVCKSTSTHLKVQAAKPDGYRTLVHFLKDNGASFHTYQIQSKKAYRVVIRNLHPSTTVTDISMALKEAGFSTRQVTNIKHHQTKNALPMFFVDRIMYKTT